MEGEEGWWEAPAGQFGAAELGVEVWLAGLHRGDALGPAGASWAPGGFWARGGGATTSPPTLRPWREVVAGLEGLPRSHRLAHLDQLETLVRLSPDIAAAKLSLCLPREGTPDALPGGEHPLQDLTNSEWLHGFALLVRAQGAGGGGWRVACFAHGAFPRGGPRGLDGEVAPSRRGADYASHSEVEALVRRYMGGEACGASGGRAFTVDPGGKLQDVPLEELAASSAGAEADREGVLGGGLGSDDLLALQRYERVVSIDIAGEAAALARAQLASPHGVRAAMLLLLRCGGHWEVVAVAHCLYPAPFPG